MKKIIVLACLCLPAFALADNTINFQGEVTSQTCSVDINGNAASPLVLLPTVPTTSLSALGDVAGQTDFTIRLTGCEAAPVGGAKINTIFVANSLTPDGNIGNVGSAKKVALQLLDPAITPAAPFDLTGGYKAAGLDLKEGATSAEHKFAVRYYAEGAATAGSVLGSVQYAVSYL